MLLARPFICRYTTTRSRLTHLGEHLFAAAPTQSYARRYATKRRPLAEMEAEREAYPEPTFSKSRTADTQWRVGQGLVGEQHHSRAADFSASRKKVVYNAAEQTAGDNYKLLVHGVIPRPIALVSSQDANGMSNLAPYSFFNATGHDPPTVMVSMNAVKVDRDMKDSLSNIYETKKFVVNIISEPFAEAANYTSIDTPHDVSEWDLSGLTQQKPFSWNGDGPPRVGESAFAVECELKDKLEIRNDEGDVTTTLVVGRVLNFVLNEGLADESGPIAPGALLPISRGGGITYLRSTTGFELSRPRWDKEMSTEAVQACLGKERG